MSVLAALLLADGRFPSGGHAHSGGLEEAVTSGRVHDLHSLRTFVVGRLATAGRVAAAVAAVAGTDRWPVPDIDAEADARIASPALRAASRRQGRQLVRAASHAWPVPAVDSPHHAVAVGVVAAAAGLGPVDAARWAAYDAVMTPATAAVRLLGLDPFSVSALVAGLAPTIDELAAEAAALASRSDLRLADLPAHAAPLLDLGAERHAGREVRLFAS